MRKMLFALALLNAGTAFAEAKWAVRDAEVANFMMLPSRQNDGTPAPPLMWLDLSVSGKMRSVAIPLCGPELLLETGARNSDISLGLLSVERWEKIGWFGPVYQAVSGKIIFRFSTEPEKALMEKEIREFREKYSCNYL